ncbi:MAG: type II secretion system F family protein [Pseudomonadota bacterium]
MEQQSLIIIGLIVFAVLALGLTFAGSSEKDKTKKRLQTIETRKNAKGAANASATDTVQKERRRRVNEALSKVDEQTAKNKKKERVSLEKQFERAGLDITTSQFYIGSVVCAVVFALIGLISGQKLVVTAGLFFVGGLGVPRWFIGFAIGRRQKKFANEFSNAIDVIVRGVKSGLPVNECLKIIAKEAPAPVSEEFDQLTEGQRIGLSLDQSLDRMFDRMPLQEVRFFGIVLMIQQKTGGNLAEALGNLAGVLRGRKLMEGKIKALSAEAKASAMIIGALPFLVMGSVKMSAPDYLDPLFLTPEGNFILLGAGVWMTTGIVVMKKMTQIKV